MNKTYRKIGFGMVVVLFFLLILAISLQGGYLYQRKASGGDEKKPASTTEQAERKTETTEELPLYTGLTRVNGTLRYYDEAGKLYTAGGWIEQDGDRYYVNSDGTVRISEYFRLDGAAYYVNTAGKMVRGFFTMDDRLRFFHEDGRMQETADWIQDDGKWYYVDSTGTVLADGIKEIKGKKYFFNEKGVLQTGKIEADELSFYYTDQDGAILTDQDFQMGEYTYHADEDGRVFVGTMYEKAQEYSSVTDYLILCNLSTQRTAVFGGSKDNWRLLREMIVSTGAPINPTPKGIYETTVHSEYFNNYGVRAWYATGFIGGLYLFHSSPYEIDSEPKVCTDDRLGIPASHGCVRMALEDAKWMYDNLPLRTKVVIYEDE